MMKLLSALFTLCCLLLFCGCVAVSQSSAHNKNSHSLSTSGPIRWYQYNRLWINNGGKPPAGVGGILYTVFTPSDWFWYGPYEETPQDIFRRYNRKDCEECVTSFNYCINAIIQRQKQIEELKQTPGHEKEIQILQKQIEFIDLNNGLGGDYTTPFKDRF